MKSRLPQDRTSLLEEYAHLDSPCVGICSTLFDEVCKGCGRTAMEVANWVFLSTEEKQIVWERIVRQGYPKKRS